MGYPLLIKASHGGGGRGMRIVHKPEDFQSSFEAAQAESKAAFGSDEVFIEKFIEKPLHIEIQVLADGKGQIIHLGERECSLQRRHQKVIEEAPSPRVSEELRARMGKAACEVARLVDYEGVGTVEFLMDEKFNFYFMEMNTRIQVEHPVTEEVTGVDLIKEQILVAMGNPLRLKQEDIKIKGHSIECRINAEDPMKFIPSPGKIDRLLFPGGRGVRVDSGVFQDFVVPPFYDSMLAKIVSYGKDREEATRIMLRALEETVIEGVNNNVPLHKEILATENFVKGDFYTQWIEKDFLNKMQSKA